MSISVNVTEMKFNFPIKVSKIEKDNMTSKVVLADIGWILKIYQQSINNGEENIIKATLVCRPPTDCAKTVWSCVARAKISLIPSSLNQSWIVPATEFNKSVLSSDPVDLIKYTELDELKQYEYGNNGRIVFEIQLFANPTKFLTPTAMNLTETKFQFVLEDVGTLERIESPELIFGGTKWHLAFKKWIDEEEEEDSLAVYLYNNRDLRNGNWQWTASCTIKLLSADKDVQPIIKHINHTYCYDACSWGYATFITWNILMDPTKGFVNDDKAVFEVNLEVEPPKLPADLEEKQMDENLSDSGCFVQENKKCRHSIDDSDSENA